MVWGDAATQQRNQKYIQSMLKREGRGGRLQKVEANAEAPVNTEPLLERKPTEAVPLKLAEQTSIYLPKQHSLPNDSGAPWHEMPAANGLLQKRLSPIPLAAATLPRGGHQLDGGGQVADRALNAEVDALCSQSVEAFTKHTHAEDVLDVDGLGNIVWKDKPMRNHLGFSYANLATMRG